MDKHKRVADGASVVPASPPNEPTSYVGDTADTGAFGFSLIPRATNRRSKYAALRKAQQEFPPIRRALTVRTETALQTDAETKRRIWFKSDNQMVLDTLEAMSDRLWLEHKLAPVMTGQLGLGDAFVQPVVGRSGRVVDLRMEEVPERVNAVSDSSGRTVGYVRVADTDFGPGKDAYVFPLWQMLHCKRDPFATYGTSELEFALAHMRKLQWMYFAAMLNRIFRSSDRLQHKVDVSDCATEEDREKRMMAEMMRHNFSKYIDSNNNIRSVSGRAWMNDIFTAIRTDSPADVGVEVLQGQKGFEQIMDLKMIREEVMSVLGVPLRHLGLESQDTNTRAEAQTRDRGLLRLANNDQELLLSTVVYPICEIELALHGVDTSDIKNSYTANLIDLTVEDSRQVAEMLARRAQTYVQLANTQHFDTQELQKWVFGLSDSQLEIHAKGAAEIADALSVQVTNDAKKRVIDPKAVEEAALFAKMQMYLDDELSRRGFVE